MCYFMTKIYGAVCLFSQVYSWHFSTLFTSELVLNKTTFVFVCVCVQSRIDHISFLLLFVFFIISICCGFIIYFIFFFSFACFMSFGVKIININKKIKRIFAVRFVLIVQLIKQVLLFEFCN